MKVSVKKDGALGCRLNIGIPLEDIKEDLTKQVHVMCKKKRLDGFRPGKVPPQVIEQRFGDQIFYDVAQSAIKESYIRAIEQEQLNPAGQPSFEDVVIEPGQDISFVARIELYPEFKVSSMKGVKLEKPVAEIAQEDIDTMVERVRKNRMIWTKVEREAKDGDRITFDFGGSVSDRNAKQGKGMQVILGDEREGSQFSEQLQGSRRGESRQVTINGDAEKQYEIEIKLVEEGRLPDLNDEFFEACDIKEGGLAGLQKTLKEGMEMQLKNSLKSLTKANVMDALLAKNKLQIPGTLVRQEIDAMKSDTMRRMNLAKDKADTLADDLYRETAERRVRLGLLLHQYAEQNKLESDPQMIEKKLDELASAYDDPEGVKRYYRNDKDARFSLEALVLEEQIVQNVLDIAKVSEKSYSFDDIIKKASQSEKQTI